MVEGGGDGHWGKKENVEIGEKNKKRRKIAKKTGEKALKCIFLGYKIKKISRGAANLYVVGKTICLKRRGGGE